MRKFEHTVELTIRDDRRRPIRRYELFYFSIATIILMIAIALVIREIIMSLDYWLFEYTVKPLAILAILLPVRFAFATG